MGVCARVRGSARGCVNDARARTLRTRFSFFQRELWTVEVCDFRVVQDFRVVLAHFTYVLVHGTSYLVPWSEVRFRSMVLGTSYLVEITTYEVRAKVRRSRSMVQCTMYLVLCASTYVKCASTTRKS